MGQLCNVVLGVVFGNEYGLLVVIGVSFKKDGMLVLDDVCLSKVGSISFDVLVCLFIDKGGVVMCSQVLLDKVLGEIGLLVGKMCGLQSSFKMVFDQQVVVCECLVNLCDSYINQFNCFNLMLVWMQVLQFYLIQ